MALLAIFEGCLDDRPLQTAMAGFRDALPAHLESLRKSIRRPGRMVPTNDSQNRRGDASITLTQEHRRRVRGKSRDAPKVLAKTSPLWSTPRDIRNSCPAFGGIHSPQIIRVYFLVQTV